LDYQVATIQNLISRSRGRLCATDEGVVEGNVHQLNNVANGTHD
jgi:hypothetical protein